MSDNGKELLTIILTTFNRRHMLSATLSSISRQIQPQEANVKLLIIDNGSTDDVVMMINKWIETKAPHWLNTSLLIEKKRGACAARNQGLSAARSEWIMFFDSDDLMEPYHINRVIQRITQSDADIIYWDVMIASPQGKSTLRRGKVGHDIWLNVIMRGSLSTQRYCCRRNIMINAGGWDESLERWNDWELSVRLIGYGARTERLSGYPNVKIISHPDSITGSDYTSSEGKWEQSIDAVIKYTSREGLRKARQYTLLKMAVLAGNYAREGNRPHSHLLLAQAISCSTLFMQIRIKALYHWQRIVGKWSTALTLLCGI